MPGPPLLPAWDGTFQISQHQPPAFGNPDFGYWYSPITFGNGAGNASMDGHFLCGATLSMFCDGNVLTCQIQVQGCDAENIWTGVKLGGSTPEGVYDRISGTDITPASLTISLLAGVPEAFPEGSNGPNCQPV